LGKVADRTQMVIFLSYIVNHLAVWFVVAVISYSVFILGLYLLGRLLGWLKDWWQKYER
jgi:hypothetical protein